MNGFTNEEFIYEMKMRPMLWKSTNLDYKNKVLVKKFWEDLQKTKFPNYPVEELKKKWKNLKDQYRKEVKKIPPGDGANDTISSGWRYYELLSFLKDEIYMSPLLGGETSTKRKHAEVTTLMAPSADDILAETKDNEVFNEGAENMSPESDEDDEPPLKTYKTRPSFVNKVREQMLIIEKKKLKIIEDEIRKNSELTKSDSYHFFMSLMPEVEKLPVLQKMRFRSKVTMALIDELTLLPQETQQKIAHPPDKKVTADFDDPLDSVESIDIKEEPIMFV